ncbi:MAG: lantipeptide synthetase, partial [Geodermatophilaceae bacterium]|nr:lantipeptide synthetase [Geodermatophilaceae bacterium]
MIAVDRGHEGFCLADPLFYDDPARARDDDVDFAAAHLPLPPGWRSVEFEDWLAYGPPGQEHLPTQGWKLHISTTVEGAAEVLSIVRAYCLGHDLAFKFVRSAQLLLLANGKYAHRGSSGKFVTLYPADDAAFERVATDLDTLLGGRPGPYILSDLRLGAGPVYVRYGGFTDRWCIGPDGELVPAIEAPGGGLVPDRRGATFHLPSWVELPRFLQPHVDARAAMTVVDLPYRIVRPLHFSNGGGVYLAEEIEGGRTVVLKEARPHAGLAMDGSDAVARLHRERDMLGLLAG